MREEKAVKHLMCVNEKGRNQFPAFFLIVSSSGRFVEKGGEQATWVSPG